MTPALPWRLALGCALDFFEAFSCYGQFALLPLLVLVTQRGSVEAAFAIMTGAYALGSMSMFLWSLTGRKHAGGRWNRWSWNLNGPYPSTEYAFICMEPGTSHENFNSTASTSEHSKV